MIQLVKDTINKTDIDNLIEWLKNYPKLTKGDLTIEFERQFAEWVGTKYAVFVNSGSSANLLMLYALKLTLPTTGDYMRTDKIRILVPSLCWATDLAPIIQLGMEPVLVDCNLEDLSINLKNLEEVIATYKPKALLLVSVLGLCPNMKAIKEICKKNNIILLEDVCESQGTKFDDKKLGTFGTMATFSTYFGHTMSTIEGGFIVTDNKQFYNTLISLRSHGWDRDLDKNEQKLLREKFNVSNFNALYTFYLPGFNVRNTEIGAYLGIEQLKKVDEAIKQRNLNFKLFIKLLEGKTWVPTEQKDSFTASFCIPVIFKNKQNKENAIKEFQMNNIEIRPLIAGTMGKQPFYIRRYGEINLPSCNIVDERGIYVPNHPLLTEDEIKQICDIIIKNDK